MTQFGFKHKRQINRKKNAGFTLVEVVVTMAVMAILLAVVSVSLITWIKRSEFNKCNEYARSIYTAASMKLSYLDLNDELDQTMDDIVGTVGGIDGVNNLKNTLGENYFPSDVHSENMYYLYAEKGDYDIYLGDKNYGARATGQDLLFSLIDEYTYDKSILNSNIWLEINVDTGEVYSVFVSTFASALTYTYDNSKNLSDYDEHGIVSLNALNDYAQSRCEDTRYELVLGYFSSGEGIAANFKTRQLSVTTNELINDETLHLRFASNSLADMNRDVKFKITVCQPSTKSGEADRKLFAMSVSMLELEMNTNPDEKYDANAGTKLVPVEVNFFDNSGNEIPQATPKKYYFPFSVDSLGVMDLALDAAVSARVETITDKEAYKKYNTSIMRFLNDSTVQKYLEKTSPDLYAEIFVQALTKQEVDKMGSKQEIDAIGSKPGNPTQEALYDVILDNIDKYVSTAATVSNTENALYEKDNRKADERHTDATGMYDEIMLGNARHLANVRYYDAKGEPFQKNNLGRADFVITKDIDFATSIIYDACEYNEGSGLCKIEAESDLTKQFTTIPRLYEHWTLSGKKGLLLQDSYTLANFLIGNQSVCESNGSDVNPYGINAKAVGIVGVNEGTIEHVNIGGSTLTANTVRSTETVSGGALGAESMEQYVYCVEHKLKELEGAGMLCGINSEGAIIDAVRADDACVAYAFLNEGSVADARGVGMVIGIQKGKPISRVKAGGTLCAQILENEDALKALDNRENKKEKEWDWLFLEQTAPATDLEDARAAQMGLAHKKIGIGGIAGVTIVREIPANSDPNSDIIAAAYGGEKYKNPLLELITEFLELIGLEQEKPVVNAVNVCGNQYTGGVTGNLVMPDGADHDTPVILNALNKGMITACTYATDHADSTKGLYFGGIAGYANCGLIRDCVAKPGVESAATAAYQDEAVVSGSSVVLAGNENTTAAHQSLMKDTRGTFVGGIVGFADDVLIRGCETRSDSYVIGYDNVGGIAGMITGSAILFETKAGGDDELTQNGYVSGDDNKGYVIGHDNVGGIVGENGAGYMVSRCTNRGIVAGHGKNIGGIAGRNHGSNLDSEIQPAVIDNCGSFVYDYSGSMRDLVWDIWQIFGNNSGGIVGYNEYGTINCSDTGESSNYTVSSIVIGKNNVGGVVGLNGEHGKLSDKLQVEGGQVLAVGDAVGGYIGTNLSTGIFINEEDKKPLHIKVKPYRVEGAKGVGGVIGVNLPIVGDEATDLHIKASNENIQGSVEGKQLVGGIIGVHRSLRSLVSTTQTGDPVEDPMAIFEKEIASASAIELLFDETAPYTDAKEYQCANGKIEFNDTDDTFTTTIGIKKLSEDGKKLVNNAEIYVGGIGGGVLGYSALASKTVIKNYENTGVISESEDDEARVNLTDYAAFKDENLRETLKDQKSALIAGVIGYANENLTVQDCENHGDILAENGSGGIAAINHGTIKDCENAINMGMPDSSVIGGVAAINCGPITSSQMGSKEMRYTLSGDSFVGGIAGINVGTAGAISAGEVTTGAITTDEVTTDEGTAGAVNYADIGASTTGEHVGGVVGYNDALVTINHTIGTKIDANQSISGGYNVGGIIGTNAGEMNLSGLSTEAGYTVTSKMEIDGERYVGGWVGRQESVLRAQDRCNRAKVTAQEGYAGGIAGIVADHGEIDSAQNVGLVHAYGKDNGLAGGITAYVATGATISGCKNKASVASELSYAGGVAAVNAGKIKDSVVTGSAVSESEVSISGSSREMGVFVARNEKTGTIDHSIVDAASGQVKLEADSQVIGLFAGVNYGTISDGYEISGSVKNAAVYGTIDISQKASGFDAVGGIAGENYGEIDHLIVYRSNFEKIKDYHNLGGIAGKNYAKVEGVSYVDSKMSDQTASSEGSYYGGIVGLNSGGAIASGSSNTETDEAIVSGSSIKSVIMDFHGAYHANSSQSAEQKEALSVMVGGIAGANKERSKIIGCSIDTTDATEITNKTDITDITELFNNRINVENGIVGGITGFNQGVIEDSGFANTKGSTAQIMGKVRTAQAEYIKKFEGYTKDVQQHTDKDTQKKRAGYKELKKQLNQLVEDKVISKHNSDPVMWENKTNILKQSFYNWEEWTKENDATGDRITTGKKMLLKLNTMGCVGGIAGYNTGSGSISYCMTGDWIVYNRSDSSESSIGGVIGLNESEADLGYLVNRAFVGRESTIKKGDTPRDALAGNSGYFVGGIIGEQRNSTSINWSIYGCINTGSVYNRGSNYAAGILGRWTDNGGILEYCNNYGAIQNTFSAGEYGGSSTGIVAELYHPVDYHAYRILSCRNDGNIYVGMPHLIDSDRTTYANSGSNENAGMMGTVVCNYVGRAPGRKEGQHVEIDIVDCVNGPDSTIQAGSMAVGMLAYMGSDYVKKSSDDQEVKDFSTENVIVKIDRCRSYGLLLGRWHSAGMFGDRYSGVDKTHITNCYTRYDVDNIPEDEARTTYSTYSGEGIGTWWTAGVLGDNSYNNFYIDEQYLPTNKTINQYSTSGKKPSKPYAYQVNGKGTMLYIHFPKGRVFDEDDTLSFNVSKRTDQNVYRYRVEYLPMGASAFQLAEAEKRTTQNITIDSIPKNTKISVIRVEMGIRTDTPNDTDASNHWYEDKNDRSYWGLYANHNGDWMHPTVSDLRVSSYPGEIQISSVEMSGSRFDDQKPEKAANTREIIPVTLNKKKYFVSLLPEFLNHINDAKYKYFIEENKLMAIDSNDTSYAYQAGEIIAPWNKKINENEVLKLAKDETVMENYYKDYVDPWVDSNGNPFKYPSKPGTVTIAAITDTSADKPNKQSGKCKVTWTHSDMSVKYYLVDLYTRDDAGNDVKIISDAKFCTNEALFDLDARMAGKYLSASVRAVNSNEAGMSEPAVSSEKYIGNLAPTPEFRIELVKKDGKYTYRYALSNESRKAIEEKVGNDWKVNFYFQGENTSYSLTATKSAIYIATPEDEKDSDKIKRLYAQTISQSEKCLPSEQYSTQVDVRPLSKIIPNLAERTFAVNVTGSSIADTRIEVKIGPTKNTKNGGLFPVYRVEIINDQWEVNGIKKDMVYAYRDVTIPNDGCTVVFDDLPEERLQELGKNGTFKVHVWLARTSLGPVYTWHDVLEDSEVENDPYIEHASSDDDILKDGYEYQYRADGKHRKIYSTLLADKWYHTFTAGYENIVYGSTSLHLAKKPKISVDDKPVGEISGPVGKINDKDELQYTFSWQSGMENNNDNAGYELTLTGIKGSGDDSKRTVIAKLNTNAAIYVLNGDHLSFDQIEVSVVEKSTAIDSNGNPVLGNCAKATVDVLSRMPRINQVTARLISRNDQKYRISWRALDEKYRDDFAGYIVYVNGKAEKTITDPDETSCVIDLENVDGVDFSADGQTVSFEVVANNIPSSEKPENPAKYVRSMKSIKRTITISKRRDLPVISGPYRFRTDTSQDQPIEEVSESEFMSGLYLVVPMEKRINGSYLLNGFLYESVSQNSLFPKDADSKTMKTTYERIEKAFVENHGYGDNGSPLADALKPIVLTYDRKNGNEYIYSAKLPLTDIDMAAGYLQPVIRGASNTEISSYWTWNQNEGSQSQYIQLPKVRLNAPLLTDSVEQVTRTGNKNYWSGEETFAIKNTFYNTQLDQDTVSFEHSDYASSYEVTLKMAGAGNTTETLVLDLTGVTYKDTKYPFDENGECNFDEMINQTLQGTFRSDGQRRHYRILCGLRVRKTGSGYALLLPQTSKVIGMDNRSVRVSNSTKAVTDWQIKAIAKDTAKYADSNSTGK